MAVREILLLGNEKLYRVCSEIDRASIHKAEAIAADLNDTIDAFKERYGFGRAIAAPQIDEPYRIVFMKMKERTTVFVNPVMEPVGDETYTLWDDCMSFPGLEAYVKRYKRIRVSYRNLDWEACTEEFDGDLSELFQHEYDHLDGVLAVQRAINDKALRINKEKIGKF